MSLELPEPIASYFAGQNDHNIHAMLALFAAELQYTFTLAGDKISRLEILS